MRNRIALGVLACLGIALALGCATAPPPAPALTPEQQRIERMLVDLYVPEFAEKLQSLALARAGHPRDGALAEDDRLRPRIETQLAPDAVVADVVRRMSAAPNPAYLAELERFAASQLGGKLSEAAGTPYSWWSRLGYRMFGGEVGGPPERVKLIEELDALTRSSQTSTEIWMKIYAAIVQWYAARGFIDDEESAAVGGVDGLLAREREQVDAVTARHTIPFGLYSFSDFSTPELSAYLEHLRSPAGQWFATSLREALVGAIAERSAAIAR
jgi:hypothetical protein